MTPEHKYFRNRYWLHCKVYDISHLSVQLQFQPLSMCIILEGCIFSEVKTLTVEQQSVCVPFVYFTAWQSLQNNKLVLSDWRQCFCYSLTECYRPNSADSLCGIIETLCDVKFNTDVCSAILIAVSSVLLFVITQYEHFWDILTPVLTTFSSMTQTIFCTWPLLRGLWNFQTVKY